MTTDALGVDMLENLKDRAKQLLLSQPVARLATVNEAGSPTVVPVCFVLCDGRFYSPIDDKPKSVSWGRLQRLRNIEANPRPVPKLGPIEIDHKSAA